MFIPKQYIICQKIVDILVERIQSLNKREVNSKETAIKVKDLAHQLHVSETDIAKAAALALVNDEVKQEFIGDEAAMTGWKDIYIAYANRKYLKEGRTLVINRIKDYLNITVTSIAILTAITTAVTSIVSIQNNRKEIENIKQQLAEIRQKQQLLIQPKK
jgi:hypothetical protein